MYVSVYVNGAEAKRGAITTFATGSGASVSADVYLAAGDTVEI